MYWPLLSFAIFTAFYCNAVTSDLEFHQRTLDEVKKMTTECNKYDLCQTANRRSDSLYSYACNCGRDCVQLGTCCIDSDYVAIPQPELKPICRSVYGGKRYFMIDHCPSNDSVWNNLCLSEWDHEDDIMKMVPVTSMVTSLTYKNVFCFRCNEEENDFLYWKVGMRLKPLRNRSPLTDSDRRNIRENNSSVKYDSANKTWAIPIEITGELFPVILRIIEPADIPHPPKSCAPDMKDVITDCARAWTDEDIRKQCNSYMAIKIVERNNTKSVYKNAHCALCNFEKVQELSCKYPTSDIRGSKVPFSFHFLLDFNRSNGEKVGKIQKCDEESIWDPYANRCRKLTCVLSGRIIKNGKCVPK